jgi:type III secretion protein J
MTTFLRVCLAVLFVWLLSGCQEILLSKLSEQQANEVVAALAEHGLSSSKVIVDDTNWRIQVDAQHLASAVLVLQSTGLPGARNPTMGELFKKEGLVSSPTEERVRYVYAISQELATTLKSLDGVVDARVHVVIPNNDPLAERIVPSSASIFIKHRPTVNLTALSQNIKSLVQSSVEGLDYEHISLFTFPGVGAGTREALDATPLTPVSVWGDIQRWISLLFAATAVFFVVHFLANKFFGKGDLPSPQTLKPATKWLKGLFGTVSSLGRKS